MATFTQEQLSQIIAKVAEEVGKEMKEGEAARGFQVSDLRASFADLVKGGESAWTISYSTAAAALEQVKGFGEIAWTISYSTSNVATIGKLSSK